MPQPKPLVSEGTGKSAPIFSAYSDAKHPPLVSRDKKPFKVDTEKRRTTLKSLAQSFISLMKVCEDIKREDISAVTKKLNAGIDLNTQIGEVWNPLIAAVEVDNLELVQLLLSAGANVNLVLEHGTSGSALIAASYNGNLECVQILLKAGADVNLVLQHGNFRSAIVAALCSRNPKIIESLLHAGANVNIGISFSHYSYRCFIVGTGRITKLLIDAKADIDFQVKKAVYTNALVAACRLGHFSIVGALLEAGADFDQEIRYGEYGTALVAACCSTQIETARLLLNAGANPNLQVKDGQYGSAFTAACNNRTINFLPLLLNAGANPNLHLLYGNYGNPISAAIMEKNKSAINSLIKANAHIGSLSGNLLSQTSSFENHNFEPYFNTIHLEFKTEIYEAGIVDADDKELWLRNRMALIRQGNVVKLTKLGDWLSQFELGLVLLKGIARAYIDGEFHFSCCSDKLEITTTEKNDHDIFSPLAWMCRTVRPTISDSISFSTLIRRKNIYEPAELEPYPEHPDDHNCWQKLFSSAIITEYNCERPCRGLELDFNTLIKLSAVEYPVCAGSGLILMGYSTALIPIQETEDDMIIWHLAVADHDFQLQVSDLAVIRQSWLQTQNFEYLQSKKALLGWCTEAQVLLGTAQLDPRVSWSGAQDKPTSWHWKGANLQLIAQSASPLQIGGQAGISFDRTVNTVRFSPSQNYLKCLQSSTGEQIVLYDVGAKRAWLVSLLSVLHHMILAYCNSIEEESRANLPPEALNLLNGTSASFDVLRNAGGLIVQGSNEDLLTIRELVMGSSVNLSKAYLHKPKRSTIYGYEFMDIVMDSPRSELKKQTLERKSLAWSPLLSEIRCLFCSNLGEAIVGLRGVELSSPCNSLPQGYNFLAASMQSIERLCSKYDHETQGEAHRLLQNHFWNLAGDPFERCNHSGPHDCCWQRLDFLQAIRGPQSRPPAKKQCLSGFPNGALVFGESVRLRKRDMPIQLSGLYQTDTDVSYDLPKHEMSMEYSSTLPFPVPRFEMDS
ncbi:hypothetical protein N7456_002006 [Penicillium angulare]|uniref:Uncharacterized protein n=1 Tax=Penicillium angulare TaxID=116970 RepID=A0A9W9G7K9_9EURO|nr:hypothetical protein N7456_002006 [Penicillium angulare]